MTHEPDFDIAVILNYYAPYVSGLTETARIVAEGLAARGWRVAVVATRHSDALPAEEVIEGVHLFRAPVLFRIGRGPVSPGFLPLARRIAKRSGALHLHLPMLEAAAMPWLAGGRPIVSTYHIDLWLAPTPFNRVQMRGVTASARHCIARSDHVVLNSEDQARHSVLWPTLSGVERSSIPAPCLDPRGGAPRYRDGDGYHVGFLGRIVPDKGIEFLIDAFRRIARPADRLLLAGEADGVAGGSNVEALRRQIGDDDRVRFLGLLNRERTRDFYASIDTFALTSVAESFGIVQAEAMMCGLPVVGSNLPGGRVPLQQTRFGRLTAPRDVQAIAVALDELRAAPANWRMDRAECARALYGADACIDAYADLFGSILDRPVRPISPSSTQLAETSR